MLALRLHGFHCDITSPNLLRVPFKARRIYGFTFKLVDEDFVL